MTPDDLFDSHQCSMTNYGTSDYRPVPGWPVVSCRVRCDERGTATGVVRAENDRRWYCQWSWSA
ncbi:MAG: hypothetical protein C4558_03755 [Dehalococcoidia bacterium]|nr:MAG: hypothetical protein C4558_03755 [Dehalococcoidia bacterium]